MTTVAHTTQTSKPSKAYFAHYFDEAGALTKVGASLYFVTDSGEVTEVEPETLNFLTVLGQMQLADAQRIEDVMNGGAAAIACSRQMEV
jgi:hypothetical protein